MKVQGLKPVATDEWRQDTEEWKCTRELRQAADKSRERHNKYKRWKSTNLGWGVQVNKYSKMLKQTGMFDLNNMKGKHQDVWVTNLDEVTEALGETPTMQTK